MLNKTVLVYIARGLKAVVEYEETEPDLIGEQTVLVGGSPRTPQKGLLGSCRAWISA
jgi:hypothetical protein